MTSLDEIMEAEYRAALIQNGAPENENDRQVFKAAFMTCLSMVSRGVLQSQDMRDKDTQLTTLSAENKRLKEELERVKGRIPADIQDMSDGYHTFRELYDHRCLLWINLCLASPEHAFWRPHYPGWPLLGLTTSAGQITYHVPEKFVPLFQDKIQQGGPEWDGHTSADVLVRLNNLLAPAGGKEKDTLC